MARGRQSAKTERPVNVKGLEKVCAKYAVRETESMPTGIITLDVLLGGGFPRGKMVELAGPTGIGKSSLLLAVSKNYCLAGRRVQWWDFEHALTDGLKDGVGILPYDGNLFRHLEPTTYGDAEEILESMEPEEFPDLIVVDSETAILPDKLSEISVLSMEPGVKARACSNFLLKYKGWLKSSNIGIIFINQMRTKINFNMPSVEDSAGCNAFKFLADVRLRMKKFADMCREEDTMEGKKKVVYGCEALIWAIKNRSVRSHIEMVLPIVFGKGVSGIQVLKSILVNSGFIVNPGGAWFTINIPGLASDEKAQGNKGVFSFIREHREFLEKFVSDEGLLYLTKGEC